MYEVSSNLFSDVLQNKSILEKDSSQLNRRNYLRSLTSFYEGALSILREETINIMLSQSDFSGTIDFLDFIPLFDFSPTIKENGKLNKNNPSKYAFTHLLAYTLKTMAKITGNDIGQIFSDEKWKDFKLTFTIRNRIMHPKIDTEIDIQEDEIKIIDSGLKWWYGAIDKFYFQLNEYKEKPKVIRFQK